MIENKLIFKEISLKNESEYECNLCNKFYCSILSLASHKKNYHNDIIYSCKICNNKKYKLYNSFKKHEKKCKENYELQMIENEEKKYEGSVLCPTNPYAASKAAAELIAKSYYHSFKMPIIITRGNNVYGPNQYPEKVIPVLTRAGLNHQKLPIYGNGKNIREWIYVRDHCRGIQIALEHGSPGEIYNIGTGLHLSNLDLASKVISALNLPKDSVQFVEDRKGHDFRYSVDSSKIKALGFSEETDFKNGLTSTIDWYRGNQDWWE